MRKYSSKPFLEYLSLPALFVVGGLVLYIRNPDPFLNPIVYTEDGYWLGLAFSKGWLYTFFNAKEGYLVLGNLILLWIAETGSKVFCGNSLLCLPQSIGMVSFAFYACIATFSFAATRDVASFAVRLLLFATLLMLPLGDSSNEILGRLSNVGYMFVLIAVLLVSYRERLKSTASVYIADIGLIISAATNPVVVPLTAIYLSWRFYQSRGRVWKRDLTLFLGLFLVAILIAYRMFSQHHSEVTGILHPENLIEVGVARAILYPLIFPYYTALSDFSAIILFSIWLVFVILAIKQSNNQTSVFIAYNLVALILYWVMTIGMRQSLTQQLGGYRHTFPDRYFMGLNVIVMVISLVGAFSMLRNTKLMMKIGAALLLTMLVILYATNIPWIFETNKTRMPLISGLTFADQLCESSNILTGTKPADKLVVVPIYTEGWSISIPSPILLAATEKLDCQSLKPLNINDANWNHGVARSGNGLVLASYVAGRLLQVGKAIRFADGEIRHINHVETAGRYINVFLDGMPIDGELVGYPHKIEEVE
ncbi:MAG: hypothetical protein NTY50_15405 [Methylobacter sp.]|nr:hypothetical protein [Methylobacter sp.]